MKVYHNSFYAMGSRLNAVFPYDDDELCERLFNSIRKEVDRIERKLSYFDPQSDIAKINNRENDNLHIDLELFDIFKTALQYHEITLGAFDITMRPVYENIESINEGAVYSQVNNIVLNEELSTITFSNENAKVDFGGYGKGYALEKIKNVLELSPLKNAFISFGESSVTVKGRHPLGTNWQIAIKDLFNHQIPLHKINLLNNSVSTSSNYYVDDAGVLVEKLHVINPFTCKAVNEVFTVSVISESPLQAEILSTAFLVLSNNEIEEAVKRIGNIEVVKIEYHDKTPVHTIFK
jgi:thiamine biosynthesis lipoprotein